MQRSPAMAPAAGETMVLPQRQLVGIGLLIGLPLLVGAAIALWYPRGRNFTPGDLWQAASLLGIAIVLVGAVLASMIARRSIRLHADTLTVKCSFYTARLARADISALAMDWIQQPRDLPVALRTNGVAACGYFAGWFSGRRGERCFCAVTTMPACVLRFTAVAAPTARVRLPQLLVLSCSAATAAAIAHWADGAAASTPLYQV